MKKKNKHFTWLLFTLVVVLEKSFIQGKIAIKSSPEICMIRCILNFNYFESYTNLSLRMLTKLPFFRLKYILLLLQNVVHFSQKQVFRGTKKFVFPYFAWLYIWSWPFKTQSLCEKNSNRKKFLFVVHCEKEWVKLKQG